MDSIHSINDLKRAVFTPMIVLLFANCIFFMSINKGWINISSEIFQMLTPFFLYPMIGYLLVVYVPIFLFPSFVEGFIEGWHRD